MNTRITRWTTAALACAMLAFAGCPTNEPMLPSQDSDGEDSDGEECDPVGADAQMGMLLNAPVADDVEVIVKQPQHPGSAGPIDLP